MKAQGTLPPELATITTLQTLNMQQNQYSGGLPPEYGSPGAFPSLLSLVLQQNQLTGECESRMEPAACSCFLRSCCRCLWDSWLLQLF